MDTESKIESKSDGTKENFLEEEPNPNINSRETSHIIKPESTNNSSIVEEKSKPIPIDSNEKEGIRTHNLKESLKTYQLIKKNIFLDRKKRIPTEDDIFTCDCIKAEPNEVHRLSHLNSSVSYNCGERCVNRYMCTECEKDSCPCGDYCQNRRFQLHQDANVYPKHCGAKGWGLFAGEYIKKGTFIMQYIGEIFSLNSDEGQIRVDAYSKSTCTYLMRISNVEVIDPTFKGNMARFINHSCDPNCITQKWNSLGETCVGIFAIKDIPEEAELSFDYQFDSFKTPLTKCLCGAGTCKGYLGTKPQDVTLEDWEEKLDHLPCSICSKNVEDDDEQLLICDSCNEGFHMFCLDPPLTEVPKGSWYCDECAVKKEEEENLKKKRNAFEMNKKFYDMAKKKRGKNEKPKKKLYISSDEEDDPKQKYSAQYEESYRLQKRLEKEAKREIYFDLYPPSDEEGKESHIKIKKKAAAQEQENVPEVENEKEEDEEIKEEEIRLIKEDEPINLNKNQIATTKEFKEKALLLFAEKLKESGVLSSIVEIENKNMLSSTTDNIEQTRKMINSIELEIIKKNHIIFRRIGIRIFWEHQSGRVNMFKKNIETTLMGNVGQIAVASTVFDIMGLIAEEIEKLRGQTQAILRIPAMYLRKITGTYHNQQITDLENKFDIYIQYSKEYLNEEVYPMTLMTDLKIKGMKENITAAAKHIGYMISRLKTKRLFCNRRDYTSLILNLIQLRRKILPAELRFNKTKEGILKELNHPFYYIQYKDREVALIGSEKEIAEAERILEKTLKEAHAGSDEHEFGCVHYLWPTTNITLTQLQSFKADIENEVVGTRFVYFEPIVPRKNMTFSIFGNFKGMNKAKQILKSKVEPLKSNSLSLETFQEHVKYQMIKYLFKSLHNFYITNNIVDMKFWDLQSVEFEKIDYMTSHRKQILYNIFHKDSSLQLYILYVCEFKNTNLKDIMKLSSSIILDSLKKFLQSNISSNPTLSKTTKNELIFKKDSDRESEGKQSYETYEKKRDKSSSRERSEEQHRSRNYREERERSHSQQYERPKQRNRLSESKRYDSSKKDERDRKDYSDRSSDKYHDRNYGYEDRYSDRSRDSERKSGHYSKKDMHYNNYRSDNKRRRGSRSRSKSRSGSRDSRNYHRGYKYDSRDYREDRNSNFDDFHQSSGKYERNSHGQSRGYYRSSSSSRSRDSRSGHKRSRGTGGYKKNDSSSYQVERRNSQERNFQSSREGFNNHDSLKRNEDHMKKSGRFQFHNAPDEFKNSKEANKSNQANQSSGYDMKYKTFDQGPKSSKN